jgi:thioredoxin reductase (NADPH)
MEGLPEYEKTGGVAYMVRRREDYRGKKVVIAGGGDSAVDWAVSLAEVASHIYVVHRRDKFRAAPDTVEKMQALAKAGKIEMVIPYQLHALQGAGGTLSAVVVKDLDGKEKALEADTLLPFYGLAMELGPIANWGLNISMKHISVEAATLETNIKGIYAVGDIAHYPGKLKLIACGFSEAAMAAHAIYPRVHPDKAYHFEYSTTSGVPR